MRVRANSMNLHNCSADEIEIRTILKSLLWYYQQLEQINGNVIYLYVYFSFPMEVFSFILLKVFFLFLQDFVCQMLQPRCDNGRLIRPCRAYCRVFHAGCGARLPDRLKSYFDCARFPNYFGPGSCAPEPGKTFLNNFKAKVYGPLH